MQRKGFSLIELIFVIVIIGILAVLAVPKLTATRDDATIVVAGQNINTAIKEIGAYYVAKGSFDANGTKMSNFLSTTNKWDKVDTNTTTIWDTCVSFTTTSDGNLTVGYGNNASNLCTEVKKIVPAATHQFGGTGIVR